MQVYLRKNLTTLLPRAVHQLGCQPPHGQFKTLGIRDIASVASLTRRCSQATQGSHELDRDLPEEPPAQSFLLGKVYQGQHQLLLCRSG